MDQLEIREAGPCDAAAIAEIHLTARREAMPYLYRPHTDDEMRDYFARVVGDRPSAWWIARGSCRGCFSPVGTARRSRLGRGRRRRGNRGSARWSPGCSDAAAEIASFRPYRRL
jgi:hypothetical protein